MAYGLAPLATALGSYVLHSIGKMHLGSTCFHMTMARPLDHWFGQKCGNQMHNSVDWSLLLHGYNDGHVESIL